MILRAIIIRRFTRISQVHCKYFLVCSVVSYLFLSSHICWLHRIPSPTLYGIFRLGSNWERVGLADGCGDREKRRTGGKAFPLLASCRSRARDIVCQTFLTMDIKGRNRERFCLFVCWLLWFGCMHFGLGLVCLSGLLWGGHEEQALEPTLQIIL
jgi:hypothetical protein